MQLPHRLESGVLVVHVDTARLDASSLTEFRPQVMDLIEKFKAIVLDLSDVQLMDSSGIGGILACIRRAQTLQSTVCLANPSPDVTEVLNLIQMGRMVQIYDSVDEAVSAIL